MVTCIRTLWAACFFYLFGLPDMIDPFTKLPVRIWCSLESKVTQNCNIYIDFTSHFIQSMLYYWVLLIVVMKFTFKTFLGSGYYRVRDMHVYICLQNYQPQYVVLSGKTIIVLWNKNCILYVICVRDKITVNIIDRMF